MVGYDRAHELATGIYGLEDLERIWIPRKGYTFVSKKYPEGVPRTMGRFTVGVPPSAASTTRALTGEFGTHAQAAAMLISSGVPAITAGAAIRDPNVVEKILRGTMSGSSSYGSASTGLAAGGTALARGGPSVGSVPGGGIIPVAAAGGGGGISDLSAGISGAGGSIMNMVTQYLPLVAKVAVAIIAIKIVLWMVKGKGK